MNSRRQLAERESDIWATLKGMAPNIDRGDPAASGFAPEWSPDMAPADDDGHDSSHESGHYADQFGVGPHDGRRPTERHEVDRRPGDYFSRDTPAPPPMHRQTGPQPAVDDAQSSWLDAAPPARRSDRTDQRGSGGPQPTASYQNGYDGNGHGAVGYQNGHLEPADQLTGYDTGYDDPGHEAAGYQNGYPDQAQGAYTDHTYGLRRPDEIGSGYGTGGADHTDDPFARTDRGRAPTGAAGPTNTGGGDAGTYGEPDYDAYFDDDDVEAEIDYASAVTRNALEWAVVIVGAVLVALLLRATVFQAFYIPSESMETTLLVNDRVLVNKVGYRIGDIERGDVVVFVRPDDQPGEVRDLIKRVIALPGETILATEGQVYINERLLDEPYLDAGTSTNDFGPVVVPEDHIFVMGDNRGESFDSRGFGAVSQDRVVGRAFVLFWPFNRAGAL